MSELITKLNPALVMEAMQAPAVIYEKDSRVPLDEGFYKNNTYDPSTRIGVIILPDSKIPFGMFTGCSVRKVQLLNITSIDDKAFYNCDNLTSIIIPDSVTKMGKNVFTGCTGELTINCPMPDNSGYTFSAFMAAKFTKITIGNGVTSIGDWTFYGCGDLTSVTIPDSVTSIGDNAFYHCWNLTNVTIPDSVTSIGSSAFKGCSKLEHITIGNSVTSIGDRAFYGCISLTGITIGDNVTEIGNYAFEGCSSLTSVTIPDSVTTIGERAFFDCHSLTSVITGNNIVNVGREAFGGCTGELIVKCNIQADSFNNSGFSNVVIDNNVTSIGGQAFQLCTSLASITIPDSITTIGERAFEACTLLKEVYCKPIIPPMGNMGMFKHNADGRKIYVPIASLETYKTSEYWSEYAGQIVGVVFEDEVLESGTNIKTINGVSILGEGDITISGGSIDTSNLATKDELAQKQDIISDIDTIRTNAANYKGTVTSVKVNGVTKNQSGGVVDLGYLNKQLSTSAESSMTLSPNVYYRNTSTSLSTLTITLGGTTNNDIINEYFVEFTIRDAGTTVLLPNSIKWANGVAPTFENGKTYQISIVNNLGTCVKFG